MQLPSTLAFDYPSVQAITQHVMGLRSVSSRGVAAAAGAVGLDHDGDDDEGSSFGGSSEDGSGSGDNCSSISSDDDDSGGAGVVRQRGVFFAEEVEAKVAAAVAEVVGRALPAQEPLMSGVCCVCTHLQSLFMHLCKKCMSDIWMAILVV